MKDIIYIDLNLIGSSDNLSEFPIAKHLRDSYFKQLNLFEWLESLDEITLNKLTPFYTQESIDKSKEIDNLVQDLMLCTYYMKSFYARKPKIKVNLNSVNDYLQNLANIARMEQARRSNLITLTTNKPFWNFKPILFSNYFPTELMHNFLQDSIKMIQKILNDIGNPDTITNQELDEINIVDKSENDREQLNSKYKIDRHTWAFLIDQRKDYERNYNNSKSK